MRHSRERGFEGAPIRDVPPRAGVDAALVHHYFGTKQRLFVAAMEFPVDVATSSRGCSPEARPAVGERFVRFVVELWDRPEVQPMLLGVVRSATTDPVAADDAARRCSTEGPLLALAAAIDRPDADARVALAGSQLIGLAMARYVVGVEPLASSMPGGDCASAAIERYRSVPGRRAVASRGSVPGGAGRR